jgi:hypothetical protein
MSSPPFLFGLVSMVTRTSVALVVILILAACGGGPADEATPVPIPLVYDSSAGVLVIEADTGGGLGPPPAGRHVAEVSIYGDGLVVVASEEGRPLVGTDRAVTVGHLEGEEVGQLLTSIANSGFFALDDRYVPSPAPPDLPWRQVTVNLVGGAKTVSIYPFDYADAPEAFWETYHAIMGLEPSNATPFVSTAGTLTATDLGPIDDLPAGQRNQVAPWDTPLMGVPLPEATQGIRLEGEQYGVVEEFLLRYPRGQLFGSQEGRAYQVLLQADLPWEAVTP